MRKTIGLITLVFGLAVVMATNAPQIDAQEKAAKQKKGEDKKAAPAAKVGTIEIFKGKDGYRFRIKDVDGKVIAMPPRGQDNKEDVLKDLEEIKETLAKAKPTEIKD
ncbi:MAG TPA: hypothetical protein VKE40_25050 [Gemmataceae bacterium]|nr:hypothetical protein [Gemmataceae bacterium]